MEENVQHFLHITLYYLKEVKIQLKHTQKICVVCREGSAADQPCQKWFVKFCAGHCSLDDAPPWDRRIELVKIKLRH